MDKYQIVKYIENFAPLEIAEDWDCSGWICETLSKDVKKIADKYPELIQTGGTDFHGEIFY